MELAKLTFEITSMYPKSEIYGLVSQSRRCAVSIPSNIAEGYGRRSRKEYIQFLKVAYGSSLELETQLILASRLKFIDEKKFEISTNLLQEVQKMLNSMINKFYTG